jgi:hypothetical protein
MEFVSLETRAEADFFFGLCEKNIAHFDDYTYVGGITTVGKTGWHWVNSGKRIDYAMKWLANEPNFYANNEFCLAIQKKPADFSFIDLNCFGVYESRFICQKHEF